MTVDRTSRLGQAVTQFQSCADVPSLLDLFCRCCVEGGARWVVARAGEHRAAAGRHPEDGHHVHLTPLMGRDRVFGCVILPDDADRAVMEELVDRAAMVLDRLLDDGHVERASIDLSSGELRERLGAMQFFTTALVDAVTSSEVAATLVDQGTLPLEIAVAAVALREGDDVVVAANRGVVELSRQQRLCADHGHPLIRAVSGGVALFHEGATDVRAQTPALADAGVTALAALPLRVGARILGSFLFGFSDRARIDEETRRFLRTIARQAAHALDRAHLHDAELRAHARLARLADATALLASTTDWETTLENVMRVLVPDVAEACVLEGTCGSVLASRGGPLGDRRVRIIPLEVRGRVLATLRVRVAAVAREREGGLLLEELVRRIALALDAAGREQELREAVRVRDEFLAVAGHELKTPLTTLRLYFWSARKLGADSPVTGEIAERQLSRFERLVDQLLDVTRISSGPLALEREETDLSSLVTEIAQTLIRIEGTVPVLVHAPTPVRGHWDPLRLGQVVTNLVTNALKYGGGEPIDIAVEAVGSRALLRVRDRGIGIREADRARIFERFERAVSSREFGGLGLGLWITREIVRAHGGTIGVAPGEGQAGTEFIVELPRMPSEP
ncbi:MAG: sensor histidine kinase [Polyangiales bacterium]